MTASEYWRAPRDSSIHASPRLESAGRRGQLLEVAELLLPKRNERAEIRACRSTVDVGQELLDLEVEDITRLREHIVGIQPLAELEKI